MKARSRNELDQATKMPQPSVKRAVFLALTGHRCKVRFQQFRESDGSSTLELSSGRELGTRKGDGSVDLAVHQDESESR